MFDLLNSAMHVLAQVGDAAQAGADAISSGAAAVSDLAAPALPSSLPPAPPPVENEIRTHGASEPFAHLASHAIYAQRHHAKYGALKLEEKGSTGAFVTRTIRKVIDEETAKLENGLTVLASIGSTAPFVGLFGTVWGVYHALVGIGLSVDGVTINRIAGPVGEALIMTGLGLAVAIPAVLAYNAFVRGNRVYLSRLDAFAHDLFTFLSTGQQAFEWTGKERRVTLAVSKGN
jgi:biopolymer transport protein ExbB